MLLVKSVKSFSWHYVFVGACQHGVVNLSCLHDFFFVSRECKVTCKKLDRDNHLIVCVC